MRRLMLTSLCVGILTGGAWSQPVQFLDCPHVSFVGPACVEMEDLEISPPPPAPVVYPLFAPQTMAPDTPPLLLKFLDDPTADNADAYLEWEAARLAAIQAGEALLQRRRHLRKGR